MVPAGYELHVVHVQAVHKNMMNHADEDYREAGVKAPDTKQHEGKATDMVGEIVCRICRICTPNSHSGWSCPLPRQLLSSNKAASHMVSTWSVTS